MEATWIRPELQVVSALLCRRFYSNLIVCPHFFILDSLSNDSWTSNENRNVAVLQWKLAAAKPKLAESLKRSEGGRRPQIIQPEAVSEGEKVQDNSNQTADIDTSLLECIEPQVEADAPSTVSTKPSHTGAADVPAYFSHRTPSNRNTFAGSSYLTPSQDRVRREDDEEVVLYPRLRSPYDSGYGSEFSWITSPEIRWPIDDDDIDPEKDKKFRIEDRPPSSTSVSYLQQDTYDSSLRALSNSRNNVVVESDIPSDTTSSQTPPSPHPVAVLPTSLARTNDKPVSSQSFPSLSAVALPAQEDQTPLSTDFMDLDDRIVGIDASKCSGGDTTSTNTWEQITSFVSSRSSSHSRINGFGPQELLDRTDSSISRECGASLDTGRTNERDGITLAAQQSQIVQSSPASASVSSLIPPSVSPVPLTSGLDYPQYQRSRLFPFPGMRTSEEECRVESEISGSSLPNVSIQGNGAEEEQVPMAANLVNTPPGIELSVKHRIGHQTSDTIMRYQYLNSSATASLSSQQDDLIMSSAGSSVSKQFLSSSSPPGDGASNIASLSRPAQDNGIVANREELPTDGTGTLFGKPSPILSSTASASPQKVSSFSPPSRMGYTEAITIRLSDISKDEAIVDALLDASTEPGPWHIPDASTDELVKAVVEVLSKSAIYDQLLCLSVTEAQSSLDFLQDLLGIPGLPLSNKRTFLKTSLKLSRLYGCVPQCLKLKGIKKTDLDPFAQGRFGDLWRGDVGGTKVAIKQTRIYRDYDDIETVWRVIRREAIIRGQCDHPNVLPFYGIYRHSDSSSYCLVSPFMVNGSLCQYLSNTANPDRHRLGLDITRGMSYLYKMSIVHGDLKGDNILISDDHRAVIADFALSFMMGAATFGTSSSSQKGGTVRWQAPEVLSGNPNSLSADVYSLACVYFEVLDGSIPWSDLSDAAVIMNVIYSKKHPPRPKHLAETKFPDLWWELMVRCWAHEPSDRPTLQDLMESLHVTDDIPPPKWDKSVLARLRGPLVQGKLNIPSDLPSFFGTQSTLFGKLSTASASPAKVSSLSLSPRIMGYSTSVMMALSRSDIYRQLSDLTKLQAQSTLDFLQDLLDIPGLPLSHRRTFLKTTLKLSRLYDCVPRCLTLRGIKKTDCHPFAQGHFGNLWRGKVGGTEVAVKQGKIYINENNAENVLRKMTREAIIWGQCDHPNVLPFYGIYRDSDSLSYCLVSPFMVNGSLRQYMKKTDDPGRHKLALDITRGMGYLHKMSIVHGDLKGDNILISDDHRAVIADFDTSFVMGATTSGTSSSSRKGGTMRWQAPEILDGNPNSFSADVYSLACVYFEVFDGSIPWSGLRDGTVIVKVCSQKKHLPRPRYLSETDLWWELMVQCWAHEPSDRPTLQYLMESLHATDDALPPVAKWDKSIMTRLRNPLVQGKLDIPSDLPSFLNVDGLSCLTDPGSNSVTPN